MKKLCASLFLSLLCLSAAGQNEAGEKHKINLTFYGFVRGDGSFDTRRSVTAFEGLFLLYPSDIEYDAVGKDLNAQPSSGFYGFNSRAGVNAAGLRLLNADVSAQLEGDFAGFSGSNGNSSVLRIRQAFLRMKWKKSALTVGQTWHPMFQFVTPDVISLSVGAPFNPFNRSPQVRVEFAPGRFNLLAAAIWQFQFTSAGPDGKSNRYQRNAVLPELYFGAGYRAGGVTAGVGVNYLCIRPRTASETENGIYKVWERLGSLSVTAHLKYAVDRFAVGGKTVYGQNLSDLTMVGGYGIRRIDPVTGRQEYTNFRHTTTWANISYGLKYKASLFGGYTKSLGTARALVDGSALYGDGLALSALWRLCATLTFNIPHFMAGLEYEMTAANYGDAGTFNYTTGRYGSSHGVTNHRLVAVVSYMF